MLLLFESPAGYAVFKILNEKKLLKTDKLHNEFETPEKASQILKLVHFEKFKNMEEALLVATTTVEGKMNKKLKKVLKKIVHDVQEPLAVSDAKLGMAIKEKFDINCLCDNSIQELMRCIRAHTDSLIEGLLPKDMAAMSLGLAHSLSRYKLKFTPDKIDTMIVQAISLLDDLDKELNNYVMRCKEWYGWHFPELAKVVTDNSEYIKTVIAMGMRTNAAETDFSSILSEEIANKVKTLAEISMGTEVSENDLETILALCNEVLDLQDYQGHLMEYLKNRMMCISPNLTSLVGEMVGARLISHAGSLMNLAKHAASTVQILGAEKALFRAIRARQDTPKFGLIYHAQLITQADTKLKGKISRMLAAKASLCSRVDALGDEGSSIELGVSSKAYLERQLLKLEAGATNRRISGGKFHAKHERYENKSEIKEYKNAADSFVSKKRKLESSDEIPKKSKKLKVEKVESED